ncbi:MAG: S24/S26 family peptidase [Armatimonadota bacterium]
MAKEPKGELSPLNAESANLFGRLPMGETVWLKAKGASMSPLIHAGDVLEIAPLSEIKPGMIALVNTPWGMRCHRVVSVEGGNLILRGDSLEHEEQIVRDQVLGEVRAVWRGKKRFSPYSGRWWLYGILQTRAPRLMHGLRKVWKWRSKQIP